MQSSDSDVDDESDNEAPDVLNNATSDNLTLPVTSEMSDENSLSKNVDERTIPTKSQECNKSEKKVQQQSNNLSIRTPSVFVPVNRKQEIQAIRLKLPVVAEEQIIVETINENPVVIITGETGSGE